MKRLTSNKPVDELSMFELMFNQVYIKTNEDGFSYAYIQDYDTDESLFDCVKKIIQKFVPVSLEHIKTNEDLEEIMLDNLQYARTDIDGLIAHFYNMARGFASLRERLKHYEDLEEQGLLVKLPCKVGDMIYFIEPAADSKEKWIDNKVVKYFDTTGTYVEYEHFMLKKEFSDLGKTWFLTREEAEKALEALEK